jgi:acyl phosphate:glycerol-3-phosphate acyltransferase
MQFLSPPSNLIAVLAAYALGCVNSGYYLVRVWKRTDLRQTGSGSCGASNVARLLGWPGFAITVLLDAGKGAIAVGLTGFAGLEPTLGSAALVAVVAGHVWPVQLGFRGGKGIATFVGALLWLDWPLALGLGILTLIGYGACRNYKLAGLGAVAGLPLAAWWFDGTRGTVLGLGIAGVMILIAHRVNLREEIGRFRSPAKPGDGRREVAKRE